MKSKFIKYFGLFVILNGCSPPRSDPAVLAYQKFISYLSIGATQEVWISLSKKSREKLCEKLDCTSPQVTEPTNFAIELDWAFESPFAGQATLYTNMTEKSVDDKNKFIHTIYASQSWLIPIVLEEGIWRIHLLGARPLSPNN